MVEGCNGISSVVDASLRLHHKQTLNRGCSRVVLLLVLGANYGVLRSTVLLNQILFNHTLRVRFRILTI